MLWVAGRSPTLVSHSEAWRRHESSGDNLNLPSYTMALITGTGAAETINVPDEVYSGGVNIDGNAPTSSSIESAKTANNLITGDAGNDTIDAAGGDDTIDAGAGNDLIIGYDTAGEVVNGGAGTDTLRIINPTDAAALSAGATTDAKIRNVEIIDASAATGGLFFTLVNQTTEPGFEIIGSAFADNITGSNGDDTFTGFTPGDTVDGGPGTDTLKLVTVADILAFSTANIPLQVKNIESIDADFSSVGDPISFDLGNFPGSISIIATSGDDSIIGGAGNDTILGEEGNDSLSGGAGNDSLLGGFGNDTIGGGAGNDTINGGQGNDLIDGGDGDDKITCGTGDDTVFGGDGKDTITGDAGNDYIEGGKGNDVIDGGAGSIDPYILLHNKEKRTTTTGFYMLSYRCFRFFNV